MSIERELNGRALREYRDYEHETLERVLAEEQRHNAPVAVDAFEIPAPKRLCGTLSIRFPGK